MSLADYLAKNYLTADPPAQKKSKKRKRKEGIAEETGVIIADDDAFGWESSNKDNEEDDGPTTVYGTTTAFRKSKQNNWTTIGAPAPSSADAAAADAIIASASAERTARADAADDAPAIASDEEDDGQTMQSGARAGLQTAEQVTAAIERKRAEERRKMAEVAGEGAGETIYRDASGRIVNVAMKRAEARKRAEDAARKQREEEEVGKGDVQRAMREARKKEMEEAKFMTVGRSADDVEMNEMLKQEGRWNDPAAGFVEAKKGGSSITGKPLYQGAAPPNRYGIRPGHRWDGVDRSNGFEKEYFAARNRRNNLKQLEYAWGMDD